MEKETGYRDMPAPMLAQLVKDFEDALYSKQEYFGHKFMSQEDYDLQQTAAALNFGGKIERGAEA